MNRLRLVFKNFNFVLILYFTNFNFLLLIDKKSEGKLAYYCFLYLYFKLSFVGFLLLLDLTYIFALYL